MPTGVDRVAWRTNCACCCELTNPTASPLQIRYIHRSKWHEWVRTTSANRGTGDGDRNRMASLEGWPSWSRGTCVVRHQASIYSTIRSYSASNRCADARCAQVVPMLGGQASDAKRATTNRGQPPVAVTGWQCWRWSSGGRSRSRSGSARRLSCWCSSRRQCSCCARRSTRR
jgi:hypothetical protein